jgi:hypothetical protein
MRNFAFLFLPIFMAACAADTAKTPMPTGGSRADGSVNMTFEFSAAENPIVDWEAAQVSAASRCGAWGYAGADPFEGVTTQCVAMSNWGCMRTVVTRTYQCT